ncbi:DUF2970 domain-containing protein [Nitrosospira multiformis]|uniref:Membrane protein n=1 Tax=Nitrosospira multiformis (strain ATCC 25196 / NCIMB 11849 / C 71) TaxID=323848 RepID=Q2YCM7_NITMU|nr:DUF2970 domain-containing protein [Nitrosospira multiformis]ABB73494.1 putative membrane protein [Nitrosospira multiformis ATCC 25196]SEA76128.1 Protein of unknown function [Nitrosospira multiformis]SEG22206.1 Protein of unknown function [Nitrosospira multiformis ATCC 25196]
MKDDNKQPPKGTLLQITKAVFWAFFGVRKQTDLDSDASSLTPAQVIIGGLIGAALFVMTLVLVVKIVT